MNVAPSTRIFTSKLNKMNSVSRICLPTEIGLQNSSLTFPKKNQPSQTRPPWIFHEIQPHNNLGPLQPNIGSQQFNSDSRKSISPIMKSTMMECERPLVIKFGCCYTHGLPLNYWIRPLQQCNFHDWICPSNNRYWAINFAQARTILAHCDGFDFQLMMTASRDLLQFSWFAPLVLSTPF